MARGYFSAGLTYIEPGTLNVFFLNLVVSAGGLITVSSYLVKKNNQHSASSLGDSPAVTISSVITGEVIERRWYRDGLLHRDGGLPAVVSYEGGEAEKEAWFFEGVYSR